MAPAAQALPPGAAAVLGKPISHSLSPLLHQAAYRALGLAGWRYEAIECGEDDLAAVLRAAAPDVVGYSCTMPLKRKALTLASAASAEAVAIGSANTLLRVGEHWFADNTDWIGIRDALSHAGVSTGDLGNRIGRANDSGDAGKDIAARNAVVLGAGGTAQAALATLLDVGRVTVLVRDPARTDSLAATADRLGRSIEIVPLFQGESVSGTLTSPARTALRGAGLIISTLPPAAADPIADSVGEVARAGQILLDVVYNPWPTALGYRMRAAGGQVVSGASMLLYQAARQVELMTGRAAPVLAMQEAMLEAQPSCGLVAKGPPS